VPNPIFRDPALIMSCGERSGCVTWAKYRRLPTQLVSLPGKCSCSCILKNFPLSLPTCLCNEPSPLHKARQSPFDMSSPPEQNIPTKALVVEKPGAPFVLQDIILDEVQPNEVLVDMKYAGVCHNVEHPSPVPTGRVFPY
jgi:hypothetical protein